MVGVGGSNPLSRTNSKKHLKKKHYLLLITRSKGQCSKSTQSYQFKKHLKKKHYLLLITRSKGRWFESTQSYQFKKNVGRLSGEAAPPDIRLHSNTKRHPT